MFVKNILLLLGLEKSLYSDAFKKEYISQLRIIEVLLQSPYFTPIHLGKEQSFLDNDVNLPLITPQDYLSHDDFMEGSAGIFMVGFHYHTQTLALQWKAKYFDTEIVLIKNAILSPPKGIDEELLKFNQIQLALV